MKKTMKGSLLLVIVIALFATIALTVSATEAYSLGASVGETTFTSLEGHIGLSLKPATVDADGEYTYTCVHCNVAIESGVIPKIDSKSIKLSTSESAVLLPLSDKMDIPSYLPASFLLLDA